MVSRTFVILVAVAAIGAVLVIVGGLLIPVFDRRFRREVKSFVLPENGSDPFEAWLNWTRYNPIRQEFYFFNVTNPDEVEESARNITVDQIGPYVYRVDLKRRSVSYDDNYTRLSYDFYKSYTFDREASVGEESDRFTVVNLPILNMATRLRLYNRKIQETVGRVVTRLDESLFVEVNVSDVLWGYENPSLTSVEKFLEGYFDIRLLNDTTYGLMYQSGQPKSTRYQKTFQVSTGIDDLTTLWKVMEWDGNRSLNAWKSSCNGINGTDGYSWPPAQDTSQTRYIFDAEWCRSIPLRYRDSTWIGRLKTQHYTFADDALAYRNGKESCFCHRTPKLNQGCLYRGVMNVSKCKDNVPLLLSQPHLFQAAKQYRMMIRGLTPNRQQHATTFDIEPRTGILVEASRKMQLNAYVMSLRSFRKSKKFEKNHTVLPVVWMNEKYSMTPVARDALYYVVRRRTIYDGVQFGLIALGALLIVCSIVGFVVAWMRHRRILEEEKRPLLGVRR